MKKLGLLFLFCTWFPMICISQDIRIKIVSEDDALPLPQASIKILGVGSTLHSSYTADEKGESRMKVPLDSFDIYVSYMGYVDTRLSVKNTESKDIDLGSIAMYVDSTNRLDEIVVTAQSIIEGVNKTIVFPTSQQLKASNSGIDLLQQLQLPGLFVDPFNQTVRIVGTDGVIYRINGINSSIAEVVALKASQILRVEYNQSASIRDLDSNSGAINIILKKENTGTYVSVNEFGALTTGFLNGNISVKTIFDKSELSLEYNLNWRDYTQRWSRENDFFYFPNDTLNYDKRGREAPFGYLSQNINLTYTFPQSLFVFISSMNLMPQKNSLKMGS